MGPARGGVILAGRLGWRWPCAVFIPFLFPVFHYALLNSAFVTLRHGGIRWRETFYSLQSLRAGGVRPAPRKPFVVHDDRCHDSMELQEVRQSAGEI